MTSLVRFLLTISILGGLVYGGLLALALLVEPVQREISITVSPTRFEK